VTIRLQISPASRVSCIVFSLWQDRAGAVAARGRPPCVEAGASCLPVTLGRSTAPALRKLKAGRERPAARRPAHRSSEGRLRHLKASWRRAGTLAARHDHTGPPR
jgi:hypothetical protein